MKEKRLKTCPALLLGAKINILLNPRHSSNLTKNIRFFLASLLTLLSAFLIRRRIRPFVGVPRKTKRIKYSVLTQVVNRQSLQNLASPHLYLIPYSKQLSPQNFQPVVWHAVWVGVTARRAYSVYRLGALGQHIAKTILWFALLSQLVNYLSRSACLFAKEHT